MVSRRIALPLSTSPASIVSMPSREERIGESGIACDPLLDQLLEISRQRDRSASVHRSGGFRRRSSTRFVQGHCKSPSQAEPKGYSLKAARVLASNFTERSNLEPVSKAHRPRPEAPRRGLEGRFQWMPAAPPPPSGASFEALCFRKGRLRMRSMTFERDT